MANHPAEASESAKEHNRRAVQAFQRGDLNAALAHSEEALLRDASSHEAYNNRGFLHFRQGMLDRALADFDAAIRLSPGYADAYNNRGLVHHARRDHAGALADYDAALARRPSFPAALNNRGVTHRYAGRLEHAVADFTSALMLKPEYAEARLNRAITRIDQKLFREAVADLDAVLADQPNHVAALVYRGNAKLHQGDGPGLGADHGRAISLDRPRYVQVMVQQLASGARLHLANVLEESADHIRRDPEERFAYAWRGLTLLLLGRDAEARSDLDSWRRLLPAAMRPVAEDMIAEALRKRAAGLGNTLPDEVTG